MMDLWVAVTMPLDVIIMTFTLQSYRRVYEFHFLKCFMCPILNTLMSNEDKTGLGLFIHAEIVKMTQFF